MNKKEIILIYRKRFPYTYSIEFIFDNLIDSLNQSFKIRKHVLSSFSNSFLNRTYNILLLLQFQNKIVHVIGDVHYAILGVWFNLRVLTIHDLGFMHQNKGLKRSILKWFYIILPVKFAHKVTVVSEATKTEVLNYVSVNPDKIKIIYNYISKTYRPSIVKNAQIFQPQILQIGTAFNKNINGLAEALSSISCTLIIIGKLDEKQISLLNNLKINFTNKVGLSEQELMLEYINADILTFVSTIEGFGMPILEAQACGLPVITSNCSAMPEVAGNAAVLVNPLDIASIRLGILELISNENLRNELIEKGFENVKRFSKEKTAEQYSLIYQELENR